MGQARTSASFSSLDTHSNSGATTLAAPASGASGTSAFGGGLGAAATGTTSGSGPSVSVPPPSMLRGKTIEEIVNKWTSDLEIHYKEFNRLAGEVAVWDRALIDNGNTVSSRETCGPSTDIIYITVLLDRCAVPTCTPCGT